MEMTTLEKIIVALRPMRPVLADEAKLWERSISFLLYETCREIDDEKREYTALLNEYNTLTEAVHSELVRVKNEEVHNEANFT